ncbi:hypothetical protein KC19_5G073600 [Ceratodon purpureus]|uniref:Uncharacterized protein n=1 Tax=Ceratodon purpureus TaxID=3225 RepID=A0A8T0HYW8_CERPU|nr:hypothetical protein KC19_5G073600 [Ceratodon purpureus]
MADPCYRRVKFAGTESVRRSFRRRLGIKTSTSDVLTREEEIFILNSTAASVLNPNGLILWMVYFFCRNLFIRGQDELHATHVGQIQLLEDAGIEFLRYNLSLSKNYKMDIDHCSKHSMQHSIDISDADFVDTFK